jgi:hypothetical protein
MTLKLISTYFKKIAYAVSRANFLTYLTALEFSTLEFYTATRSKPGFLLINSAIHATWSSVVM